MASRYADLREFLFRNPDVNKLELATRIRVWPSKLSALLNPAAYNPVVDDALVERIAKLLNQSTDYVRKQFPRRNARRGVRQDAA